LLFVKSIGGKHPLKLESNIGMFQSEPVLWQSQNLSFFAKEKKRVIFDVMAWG
jgi:hypothetical protein